MDSASLVVIALLGAAFAGVSVLPSRLRLPLWVGLILLAVLPWRQFQDHTHWSRVGWVPFASPPALTTVDVVGNVLLYVPFGLFLSRGRRRSRRMAWVAGAAAALSIATEAAQLYSHGRFPSATDVVLNVSGAALGALAARGQKWEDRSQK